MLRALLKLLDAKRLCSFEFLIFFYICRYFFGITKDIAKQLQGTSKDVLSAYGDISSTISCVILQEANTVSEMSGSVKLVGWRRVVIALNICLQTPV